MLRFLTLLSLAAATLHAADTATAPVSAIKASDWRGFERLDFSVEGKSALLVKPKSPAPGRPWIWRTEFFDHEPQADRALVEAGWHLAYFKIPDMYGAPTAVELMAKFHTAMVGEHRLNPRVVLEGFSRGGLYAVNFALTHPAKTAALYLDAPVLDLRSWPGGKAMGRKGPGTSECLKQALAIYGLNEETLKTFSGNPVDRAAELAKSKIPILSVCGDADKVVPFDENTQLFAERYRAAGGEIEVIAKPGVDHHPHSLKDPKPIVDFLLKKARWD